MMKDKKQYKLNLDVINSLYSEINRQKEKADKIGQHLLSQRLSFLLEVSDKEKILLENGFENIIWRSDLTRYIKAVKPNPPAVLDLEFYERIIPDYNLEEIVRAMELKIFDRIIVIFNRPSKTPPATAKEAAKERERLKDPVVFGVFVNNIKIDKEKKHIEIDTLLSSGRSMNIDELSDKLYYITSWNDNHCDLNLHKMMEVISAPDFKDIEPDIEFAELLPEKENDIKNED